MHRRLRPRRHRLAYRIVSLLVDIDRIDEMAAGLRLFSQGKFNLFGFYDRDYGVAKTGGTGMPLRAQVVDLLARGGVVADGRILLLTMPRILGFAFNPISLYYCHARDGGLRAVLAEVNNTFGERHHYVLPVADDGVSDGAGAGAGDGDGAGAGAALRQDCAKRFHVSPFLPMAMRYRFTFSPVGERLSVGIVAGDGDGPVLTAVHTAHRVALSDGALLRVAMTLPLATVKVVAGIGWEALLLWLKRVPIYNHPGARASVVTSVSAKIVPAKATGEVACN